MLHESFKCIPDTEKELAWERLKQYFEYPEAHEDAFKRCALMKMNSSWKKFMAKLVLEYVFNPAQPPPDRTNDFPFITAAVWNEFKAKKNTPEFIAISEAHRLL